MYITFTKKELSLINKSVKEFKFYIRNLNDSSNTEILDELTEIQNKINDSEQLVINKDCIYCDKQVGFHNAITFKNGKAAHLNCHVDNNPEFNK